MNKEFLINFEQKVLPEFKNLNFLAAKLQNAIHSQDEGAPCREDLHFDFHDWFTPLYEQLSALIDGAISDARAGRFDAMALVSKVAAELQANQNMYRKLRMRFDAVLDAPLL